MILSLKEVEEEVQKDEVEKEEEELQVRSKKNAKNGCKEPVHP